MATVDEARQYIKELVEEGSLRANLPPRANEKYYNPIEAAPGRS